MSMKIKICGLRRKEDIDYVNLWRPDLIGFVFAGKKRKIDYDTAKILKNQLNTEIKAVGVFVNETIDTIAELVEEGVIEVIQLHGDETESYIEALRWRVGNTKIIKAVRVASKEDVTDCEMTIADYLLFDSRTLEGYGGTGKQFDWKLIAQIQKPFFLAGGIHTENVEEAIKMTRPFAVDVSSSVETNGYKDRDKIIEIVEKVRRN